MYHDIANLDTDLISKLCLNIHDQWIKWETGGYVWEKVEGNVVL